MGNIGGREFAESLAPDVQKLLVRDWGKITFSFWLMLIVLTVTDYGVWFRYQAAADPL